MSNQTTETIATNASAILNAVNGVLPIVEALVPAAQGNAQVIKLATDAAAALIPLIRCIPTGGEVTVQEQAAQFARVYAILAGTPLTGPQWQKQV